MKKLVLTTVCALAMAGAAFAQGNVQWTGVSASAFTTQTNSTQYSPLFGGAAAVGGAIGNTSAVLGSYDFELLYLAGAQVGAPTTLAALAAWGDAGLGGANSASAGRWSVIAAQSTSAATVPWAVGTTDNIVLVSWSANLGATWATVFNELTNSTYAGVLAGQQGFFGISNPGYLASSSANPGSLVVGGGASVNGTPIQSTLTPLYLLPVTVVPEPTTLALAGLGGLGLMLFRRQRKS
jgi:hypothetical protein